MKKIIYTFLAILALLNINILNANFVIETNLSKDVQERLVNQIDTVSLKLDEILENYEINKKEQVLKTVISKIDNILNYKKLSENKIFSFSYLKYDLENKLIVEDNTYKVTRVVDGDTIIVMKDWEEKRVRLIWIDTPETVHPSKQVECFWKESSTIAKKLLEWKSVRLEADETQDNKDIYNRLLRYVFLEDDFFYNAYMIENWYAFEYTFRTAYKYQDKFKSLENKAKTNKVWFWSPDSCNWDLEIKENEDDLDLKEEETSKDMLYKYYTSSHYKAKLFYCETDYQRQWLSERYLKSFDSKEELLKAFPDRTLNQPCE